jgi:hypothetical protein
MPPSAARRATRITLRGGRAYRRTTLWLEYQGVPMTLLEWSACVGVPYGRLYSRLFVLGWTAERAINEPARRYRRRRPRNAKNEAGAACNSCGQGLARRVS